MKKLVISMLAFAAMLMPVCGAAARNVTVKEAATAGAYFMERNTMHDDLTAVDLVLVHQIDNMELGVAECYVFNVADWGWIIMAGNTAVEPVVGYSTESTLADWPELPSAMRWWVEGYAGFIGEVQADDAQKPFDDNDLWTALIDRTLTAAAKDGNPQVNFVSTTWDQGNPTSPTYNKYCPYDSSSHRYSYVGCVATAMAQIARYYKYPVQPTGRAAYYTGSNSYYVALKYDTLRFDYSQMPNRLTAYSSAAQIHNVALLSFAMGAAVNMDYTPDGSGTQSNRVIGAMAGKFKYEEGTLTYRSQVSNTSYMNKLRYDMLRHRPVYMAGASSTQPDPNDRDAAGHAWLCTGYRTDNEKMYYMNWGWSGSGNGYFNVFDNQMYISSHGYNFNLAQEILTGVIPTSADSTDVDFNTGIPTVDDNTALAPAYPNPAMLTVTLPYTTTSAADLTVYSIDGKQVATRRLQPGKGEVTLCVDALEAGVYVYRLGGKSGKFIVR